MKSFAIVSVCLSALFLLCVLLLASTFDYEASAGWGMFASFYLLAFSIVVLVKEFKS